MAPAPSQAQDILPTPAFRGGDGDQWVTSSQLSSLSFLPPLTPFPETRYFFPALFPSHFQFKWNLLYRSPHWVVGPMLCPSSVLFSRAYLSPITEL